MGVVLFTNEFEPSYTKTTILDESDEVEDIEIIVHDEGVIIRQWNDETEVFDVVDFTHHMFKEFMASRDLSEGAFYFDRKTA